MKYGDYNGNACVLGRLYTVFSSSAGQPTTGAPVNLFDSFVVASTPTTLALTAPASQDFHDPVSFTAKLTLSGTSAPVPNQTITFTVGTQSCTAVTNATGVASCTLTLNQIPGAYTVTASFAAAGLFQASSASAPFTITREETTVSYTGPTVIANNIPATLSGVLREDGVVPIAGRNLTFTLGTGATAQTCSGTTNAAGAASCTIASVNQPFGPGVVSADFAGDAFYLPSSANANTIIFAFLSRGAFVIGDQTAVGGTSVTFWSEKWWALNQLSGGTPESLPSFKGFASDVSTDPPKCGDIWTSRSGNSAKPPDTLPPYMGVLVSTTITDGAPAPSGDVPKIVVVTTNADYSPNPGHSGAGAVVTVYCQ